MRFVDGSTRKLQIADCRLQITNDLNLQSGFRPRPSGSAPRAGLMAVHSPGAMRGRPRAPTRARAGSTAPRLPALIAAALVRRADWTWPAMYGNGQHRLICPT